MRTKQKNLTKKITSFLTATALMCSVLGSNVVAFASDNTKHRATIIEDSEHGTLEFISDRYEDVYVDVPVDETESSTVGIALDENGQIVEETIEDIIPTDTEEVATEDTSETDESSSKKVEYTTMVDPRAKDIYSGDLVVINAKPDEGYSVESIYVVADSGKAITYSFNNNVISFNMPRNDVTIRATFSNSVNYVEPNNQIKDLSTYIRSNLDSSKVSVSQWTPVDYVKIKNLILDKNALKEYNLDASLDTFNAAKNSELTLVNFTETTTFIYDVDTTSDYYIAFVDTLHDDDVEISDYLYAKHTDEGIVMSDSDYTFDKNTGILYIKKDALYKFDSNDTIGQTQFQLAYVVDSNSYSHNIKVTVNDDTNKSEVNSGIITADVYDRAISLNLANDSEALKSINESNLAVKINDIYVDPKDELHALYDSSTGILTIPGNVVNINTLDIIISKSNIAENNSEVNAEAYTNYNALNVVNGPKWTFKSGNVSTTGYHDTNGLDWNYSKSVTVDYDPYLDYSAYSNYSAEYYNNNSYQINGGLVDEIKTILSGNNLGGNSYTLGGKTFNRNIYATSSGVIFNIGLPKNQAITFSNGATWNINATNDYKYIGLCCAHVGKPGGSYDKTASLNKRIYLRILKVDTTNHKITWGAIIKRTDGVTGGQAGVGVFVSNYDEEYGYFKMSKWIGNPSLTADTETHDYYNAKLEYILKNSSGNNVARFYLDLDSTTTATHNLKVKSVANGASKYDDYTVKLKPGTYYIAEDVIPNGYVPGTYKKDNYKDWPKLTITAGKTYNYNGDYNTRKNYPMSTDFNAQKMDSDTKETSVINGGSFALYYYAGSGNYDVYTAHVNNIREHLIYGTNTNKTALTAAATKAITDNDFVKVADFTAKSGTIVPTSVKSLFNGNNPAISYPTISGNKLNYLPRGHYIFIETKAPNGYTLETTVNNVPVYYALDFMYKINSTGNTINATTTKILSSRNSSYASRYRMVYNGSAWHSVAETNATYTFVLGNTTSRFSATKGIVDNNSSIKLSPSNFDPAINTDADQIKEFLKMFSNKYSVSGATYQLSVSGTVYATGTTDSSGNVNWKLASTAPAGVYIATYNSKSCVCGIVNNTTVVLTETKYSNGTVIGTKTHTYKVNGYTQAKATDNGSSTQNNLEFAKLNVKKQVKLASGNTLHKGSTIIVKTPSTSHITKIAEDEITLTETTVDNADVFLTFDNACEYDREQYFLGVQFEVYYNQTDGITSTNISSKFPKVSYNGRSASITPNSNVKHVATISYKKVNGKVTKVITPIAFSTNTSTKYKASVDDAYLSSLPLGAYMIFESNSPNSDVKNATNAVSYVLFTSNGSNTTSKTVTVTNANEESPAKFGLVKEFVKKSLTSEQIAAADGARYYVYYVNDGTNIDNVDLTKFSSDGLYKGTDDLLLVSEFYTKSNYLHTPETPTVYGVTINNIFRRNTWEIQKSTGKYSSISIYNYGSLGSLGPLLGKSTYKFDNIGTFSGNIINVQEISNIKENVLPLIDWSNYPFVGPAGTYVVIEHEAPNGFELDPEAHIITVTAGSDETANIITSKERSTSDPVNVEITKTNDQSHTTYYSFAGTKFTLSFYEGLNANSPEDISSNSTVKLVYEVKTNNSIDMPDASYLSIPDCSSNYSSYVNSRNGLVTFPDGTFTIYESKAADGYSISKDDHFKATIDGIKYDLGRKLVLKRIDSQLYVYTSDGWKPYDNNATLEVSINNDAGNPFTLNKKYADGKEGAKTTFELTQFVKGSTSQVQTPWKFTVYGDTTYSSQDDPVFESVHGKPFIEGNYYRLAETDSDGYYLRSSGIFKYTKGMSIEDMFSKLLMGDANGDHVLDQKDIDLVKQYLIDKHTAINETLADVDGNGEVGIKDLAILSQKIAGWTINNSLTNYSEPKLSTIAWDPKTTSHISCINDSVKIIDTVSISDLVVGNVYIVEGIAVDVTDPDHPEYLKDANGKYVVGSTAFLATGETELTSLDVNVEYEFTGSKSIIAGKTINFYEYLVLADGKNSTSIDGYSADAYKYDDHVYNPNHLPVAPELTEQTITIAKMSEDDNPTFYTKEVTLYMAKDTTNVVDPNKINKFSIDGNIRCIDTSKAVSHAEPKDENQNIYFPSISTAESDFFNNSHLSGLHALFVDDEKLADNMVFVYDKVTFANLPEGSYELCIEVHDWNTDSRLVRLYENIKSTGEKVQVHKTKSLQIIECESEKFYITEVLTDENGNVVATHTDKNVESQQGYTSRISTRASNYYDRAKLVLGESNAKVVDTIDYFNLVELYHSYFARGYLVDKSNDKIVAIGTKTFTNTTANSSVDVDFSFNASGLLGKTLVVYEYLYWSEVDDTLKVGDTFDEDTILKNDTEGKLISRHFDKGDANQTVYIPKVSTEISGNKKVDPKTSVTVTDNVFYENVLANQKYTIYGYLVDTKNTATESDDTLVAVGRKVDTLTSTSGTITMDFTFNASKFLDRDIVVYEYMYLGEVTSTFNPTIGSVFNKSNVPVVIGTNRLVGQHADSTDIKQTVHVNGFYMDFYKRNEEGVTLAGATFRLTNLTTNTVVGTWTSTTEAQSYILTRGDYIFEEIDAPNGKALNLGIKFTVKEADGTLKAFYTDTNEELSYTTDENGVVHYQLSIVDPDLTKLPTAGGNGTLPFTCAGIAMMLAGIAVLKKKRRVTE